MHELVNNLELYREYVQNNKNTELFVALSDCYYINCVDNFVDFQHKNTKGMGLRKFNRNSTDFMCCDGISLESLELFQKKVVPSNHFPPAKIIPFQKNNFTPCNYQDIRNMDITISPKECHLLWDNLSSMIHSESDSLEKLYIQYQREAYFLFSSTGIEGYSVRTIFSPGIETKSNPGCFYCISPKILPFTGTSIMKNLGFSHETLPMASSITNVKYIMFSGAAISKILYLLTALLCKDMVLSGTSAFDVSDIGKNIFSNAITLEENSLINEAIVGNVDGEGMPRIQTKIIERGVLRAFFSDFAPDSGLSGTSSAYRFSHIELPKVQPTKVAVVGTDTTVSILDNYDNIAKVDDLTGIIESFNPRSSGFSAYAIATIYHGHTPVARLNINIKTTLVDILNKVICISSDGQYGGNGAIYGGSFLVKNQDIIST